MQWFLIFIIGTQCRGLKNAAESLVLTNFLKCLYRAEAYRKEYQTKYPVYSRLYTDLDKNG